MSPCEKKVRTNFPLRQRWKHSRGEILRSTYSEMPVSQLEHCTREEGATCHRRGSWKLTDTFLDVQDMCQ